MGSAEKMDLKSLRRRGALSAIVIGLATLFAIVMRIGVFPSGEGETINTLIARTDQIKKVQEMENHMKEIDHSMRIMQKRYEI